LCIYGSALTLASKRLIGQGNEHHRADYAPNVSLSPMGVAELIAMAEIAISALQSCRSEEQTAFSALVLLKLRK